jgi:hypothetical protein
LRYDVLQKFGSLTRVVTSSLYGFKITPAAGSCYEFPPTFRNQRSHHRVRKSATEPCPEPPESNSHLLHPLSLRPSLILYTNPILLVPTRFYVRFISPCLLCSPFISSSFILIRSNAMQQYAGICLLQNHSLHISGVHRTHHQENIKL